MVELKTKKKKVDASDDQLVTLQKEINLCRFFFTMQGKEKPPIEG